MPLASLSRAALASLLLLTGACDEDPSGETPDAGQPDAGSAFTVGGSLTAAAGKQVPASAKLMVLWAVSSGSPDYVYKFGEGTSTGASFSLQLPQLPPADALNRGELGVGLMLLEPGTYALADGRYEDADPPFEQALGAAGQYAIIYKAKEQVAGPAWAERFPVGYSCGKGAPPATTGGFETFEPVSCASISVTVDDIDNIEFVNWT
ncbi:MAG TPA: hypothetical protein VE153_30450 [Myxococcus sp.]|nr:hypothetical protein [Myxococcus sp.]